MIHLSSPIIGDAERGAVDRVMATGMLAQGVEVEAFEAEFSAFVDDRTCVAVSSGTSALHLGLLALGIGPGDEVIVPSFTFAATANAVRLCGADPVFVDIDPATFCVDPAAVAAAVGPRTAAVMPVHLYGHPADMTALRAVADRSSLALVEDAAQAHLATWDGRPVGALGDLAMFSFYPTKNMTTGEGGMVVTADEQVARTVRLLRNQGMAQRYANELVGFNARMTDLGGAIGRVQLTQVEGWTARRQANAARLDAELTGVVVPPVAAAATHAYHQYTVRSGDRDALADHLRARGIASGVYYPTPVHRLPSFGLDLDLPETERAATEVLSLPVRPDLTDDEVTAIVEAVNGVGSAGGVGAGG
ncbi:DegT/DnrJ/EryC1/StrS family aminotransferase [Euzebya sp.]|uniref:DegT/DnrJ/EryC1/StrS family aminotransferase n=1 Tax=Euzebya sp. TaxID=1971409 RepID=UPI003513F5AE